MNTEEHVFDDLTPIPVEDEAVKDVVLCKIMYSEEFKLVFGYLRRLMQDNELSKRAMFVANQAIHLVPAHYTVWEYKYRIVKELITKSEYSFDKELEWCFNTAINNEKNYQIWHYIENIIDVMINSQFNGNKEKCDLNLHYEVIERMLDSDEKNYHVWSHKRWLVQYFELFRSKKELEYVTKLINADVRNNSAWNFRHFIVFGDNLSSIEDLEQEVEFTMDKIEKSITNPSSWNYMKFLYNQCKGGGKLNNAIKTLVYKYSSEIPTEELDSSKNRVSVPAFELLSTIYGAEGEVDKQKAVFELLGTRLDPVRRNYWALQHDEVF